jgi:HTH-type transcriptional regulator/antitoxin MqsA
MKIMRNIETLPMCDACGEGKLHHKTRNVPEKYKSVEGQLAFQYSVCDVCRSEILDAADLLNNKREWVRFKKRVERVPLGVEIQTLRKSFNLTQQIAAEIFGGGPVAFSKYENDDLIPDESMVNLLKLAIAFPDTIKHLAKINGVVLPANEMLPIIKAEYYLKIQDTFAITSPHLHFSESRAHIKVAKSERKIAGVKSGSSGRRLTKSFSEQVINVANGSKPWVLQ